MQKAFNVETIPTTNANGAVASDVVQWARSEDGDMVARYGDQWIVILPGRTRKAIGLGGYRREFAADMTERDIRNAIHKELTF